MVMRDPRNKILALNIKAERHRKDLSQFELAEKINVSEGTISLIERGLQTPSVFLVYDIAKVLKISFDRHGGIPQPTEPIIPITYFADGFGQTGSKGGQYGSVIL